MMKILEYDQVDPLSVLQLNLLALEFPLTPEHVAHIRRSDPRPFPFFAIYAVEGQKILGQVGVFRLPMVSTEGQEDVGGVWAVSTHPHHAERGVASLLLDEAHARMRDAGLRFSTLGTNRYRVAYKLYQQQGYEDMQVLSTALARWETAHQPTRLRARPISPEGFDLVDQIFENIAGNYLGYARRHTPFSVLRDKVDLADIWMLMNNKQMVGYAIAQKSKILLNISSLLLSRAADTTEAVAAVVNEVKTPYVKIKITRPVEIASLQHAGYQVAHPTWGAFMLKSLVPDVTIADARHIFGIGTDRFLISWLDVS